MRSDYLGYVLIYHCKLRFSCLGRMILQSLLILDDIAACIRYTYKRKHGGWVNDFDSM